MPRFLTKFWAWIVIALVTLIAINFLVLTFISFKFELNGISLKQLGGNANETRRHGLEPSNSPHPQTFSFAVLGDNKYSIYNFHKVLQDIKKNQDVEFIVNTGDIGYPGTCLPMLFYRFRTINNSKPILTIPGNHETFNGSLKCFEKLIGPRYFFLVYKHNLLIFLDDSNYVIDNEQFVWLNKILAEYSNKANNTFIFMHVPIILPDGIKESLNGADPRIVESNTRQKVLDLIKRYQVKIVFFGHLHGYYNYKKQNQRFIITGGAGTPALLYNYKINKEMYQNHWVKVTVDNANVDIQFMPVKTYVCSQTLCKIIYDVISLVIYWMFVYGGIGLFAVLLYFKINTKGRKERNC